MPCVYILCGLPFAGKTFLAKALVRHLNLPRVSIDEINSERGLGFDNAPISSEDWGITYAESYTRLDAYLRAGRSVVYDAANFTRAERDKARAVAAQSGSEAVVLHVTTPELTSATISAMIILQSSSLSSSRPQQTRTFYATAMSRMRACGLSFMKRECVKEKSRLLCISTLPYFPSMRIVPLDDFFSRPSSYTLN